MDTLSGGDKSNRPIRETLTNIISWPIISYLCYHNYFITRQFMLWCLTNFWVKWFTWSVCFSWKLLFSFLRSLRLRKWMVGDLKHCNFVRYSSYCSHWVVLWKWRVRAFTTTDSFAWMNVSVCSCIAHVICLSCMLFGFLFVVFTRRGKQWQVRRNLWGIWMFPGLFIHTVAHTYFFVFAFIYWLII